MSRLIELADAYALTAAISRGIHEDQPQRKALVAEIERVEKDADRYQWIRMRLRVKKMKAVSGSVRDAIDVRVGCSFLDSGLPHTIPETYPEEQAQKLDAAIDAAIDAMKEQTP